jgi:glycerophosphoryl diester phosphodiesterase
MTQNNLLYQLPRPTIFAHRGSSKYAPENTLAAFVLAVEQGADAIELDAKLTADNQVVVIHDQTVDRTTSSAGLVKEKKFSELCKLDAGSHFDNTFAEETIPSLDQVFEAVGRKIFFNIELTNYTSITDGLPEKVAQLVKKHDLASWVMFSSFNPIALFRARRILPNVPIGLLALLGERGAWARSRWGKLLSYQALHPNYLDITQELVEKLHKQGCRVHPYTVNQADDMRNIFRLDTDGIITDDPILAGSILNRIKSIK